MMEFWFALQHNKLEDHLNKINDPVGKKHDIKNRMLLWLIHYADNACK